MTYYDILGVPSSATQDEIRHAYRLQIRFFHPDVFKESEDVARIKTLQLNEAYSVLSNPEKRCAYDLELLRQSSSPHEKEARPNDSSESSCQNEPSSHSDRNYSKPKKHRFGFPYGLYVIILFCSFIAISIYLIAKDDASRENSSISNTSVSSSNSSAPSERSEQNIPETSESTISSPDEVPSASSSASEESTSDSPSLTDTVYTTESGKLYHLQPDCVYLKYGMRITTFGSATSIGLTPCPLCCSSSSDSSDVPNPETNSSPRPVSFSNGEIIHKPSSEMVCPLDVSVRGLESYYIYLKSLNSRRDDMSFMITPSSTVSVSVPIGNYELFYATGIVWYGPDRYFGDDTQFYKADDTMKFYSSGDYVYGFTLELYEQYNGNLSTDEISFEDFP